MNGKYAVWYFYGLSRTFDKDLQNGPRQNKTPYRFVIVCLRKCAVLSKVHSRRGESAVSASPRLLWMYNHVFSIDTDKQKV